MRKIISSVALSLAIVAQSASPVVSGPNRNNSAQGPTGYFCNKTIGLNGVQLNWQALSPIPVGLSATDYDGNVRPVAFEANNSIPALPNSGGVGLTSTSSTEYVASLDRRREFGYRNFKSETVTVDFGVNAPALGLLTADVTLSRFYIEDGKREKVLWQAIGGDGSTVLASGTALSTAPNSGGNPGYLTFSVASPTGFRYLKLTPQANVDQNTLVPVATANDVDNSDFLLRQIKVTSCTPGNEGPDCDERVGTGGTDWVSSVASVTALDFNGNAIAPEFVPNNAWRANSGGVGVRSNPSPEVASPTKPELAYRNGKTEALFIDFGTEGEFTGAEIRLSRFYIERGSIEQGKWEAFNAANVSIASGVFSASEPIGNGGPGYKDITIATPGQFRYLKLTASVYLNSLNVPVNSTKDNSDYLVREIKVTCPTRNNFCLECDQRIGTDGEQQNWLGLVGIEAKNFNGVVVPANFVSNAAGGWRPNSGGLGVVSNGSPEVTNEPRFEIGFRGGKTEQVKLDFGTCGNITEATVRLARFYVEGYTERGSYVALAPNGTTVVASGDFLATEAIGANGPGYFDLEISATSKFRYLVFTAKANVGGSGGPDNSDYLIREIQVRCASRLPDFPCDAFVVKEGAQVGTSADITAIDFNGGSVAPTVVPNAGNWRPNSGGIGVETVGAPETGALARLEIGFRNNKQEELVVDFSRTGSVEKAKITVARFYIEGANLREQGVWEAYDESGSYITRGTFTATENIGIGGAGLLTFEVDPGQRFTKLVFKASCNTNAAGDLIPSTSDNSDYLVREIQVLCTPRIPDFPCDKIIGQGGTEANWTSSGVDLFGYHFNGSSIGVRFSPDADYVSNSGGFGVLSVGAPETGATARFEIGFRANQWERASVDFSRTGSMQACKVTLSRFYKESGYKEQAFWIAYDENNVEVARGQMLGYAPLGGGNPGIGEFYVSSPKKFVRLDFIAAPYLDALNNPVNTLNDNSDYLIRQIEPCVTRPAAPESQGNNTGAGFSTEEFGAVAYPVPATDKLNIALRSTLESTSTASYVLRDLSGKVVVEGSTNLELGLNEIPVSVKDLTNGMYILSVTHGSNVQNLRVAVKH